MSVGTNIQTVNFNNIQPKMQTNFKAQSSPVKDYPTDTVEINGKKKNGMSNGAKVGIGLGILGTAALAIGLIAKGRGSQAKEVVKHIDFKPAKTIEEAKQFAKDKLDVIYFDEFGKFEDVEMVNFINEWIVKTHNNPKFGRNSYPKIVYNADHDGAIMSMTTKNAVIDGVDYGYGLGVNLKKFKEFEPQALKKYNLNFSVVKKGADGKYFITDKKFDNEYTRRLVKNLNSDSLTFEDKMQLMLDMLAYKERKVINGVMQIRGRKVYNYLNHEQGHLLHSKNCNNYEQMRKVEEYINNGQEVSEITKEFVNNKDIQAIAGKVSNYAKESPLEFVAETFAGLRDGIKFDDDVMALYKKYNGPIV